MTAGGMSGAIKTQILAIAGISITSSAELQAFCDALGTAIVGYIQANAAVTVSVSGVQPGVGTVPGTGGVA